MSASSIGHQELNTIKGFYFDTVNVISAVAEVPLLEAAMGLCSRYEQLLSRFVAGSDVWRINHAQGQPVVVGADTAAILACAEEVRRASQGAFNICIGAASALWDFKASEPRLPENAELEAARERIAQSQLTLEPGGEVGEDGSASIVVGSSANSGARDSMKDTDGCTVVRATPGTVIDLGGIAKGYICDQVANFLRSHGVERALLNFGGNVVAIGQHPQGRPWNVGLQTPGAERDKSVFASLPAADCAVVTSGAYERGFELDGKRYHHILDPRTCLPAEQGLLSVTVVANNAMLADALATAILVSGAEAGPALAAQYEAGLVTLDAQGQLSHSEGLELQAINQQSIIQVASPLT
ncbi:MAG: FAD:protein FMN transferase [Coriobacteriales bacterium]|nr:FAD:protein FMN transferase [Coriobacteriales bacterium]